MLQQPSKKEIAVCALIGAVTAPAIGSTITETHFGGFTFLLMPGRIATAFLVVTVGLVMIVGLIRWLIGHRSTNPHGHA